MRVSALSKKLKDPIQSGSTRILITVPAIETAGYPRNEVLLARNLRVPAGVYAKRARQRVFVRLTQHVRYPVHNTMRNPSWHKAGVRELTVRSAESTNAAWAGEDIRADRTLCQRTDSGCRGKVTQDNDGVPAKPKRSCMRLA